MSDPKNTERSLWLGPDGWSVEIIDQTKLPYEVAIARLGSVEDAARAIVTMQVRGAPLIGVTAAYGAALALREDASDESLAAADALLRKTRPTAANLGWALDEMHARVQPLAVCDRVSAAYERAAELVEEDVAANRAIGEHGLRVLRSLLETKKPGAPLQILTHCNAGRLATVDWGTATAPIYLAHQSGLPIHVWVSETRPRNQGAALTAWELGERGVPLTVIADNAAGHLIQRGAVDIVIVGADRVTAGGDVANKVGTYLKALAANAHQVPFYVAFPETTIDWKIQDGIAEIPIEQRDAREVTHVTGAVGRSKRAEVRVTPEHTAARNDAFDVTPARFVTGFITDRGVCGASAAGLKQLFPDAAINL
ncbi:MAG: S-methyl-5-thioribose-1-phosphate isomerase [Verrucomicrobia bacterium]|nr:S-methyl-5-thioribose-1-phosphate isomerase [Verrucomicrobiota bacterium]MBV9128884.1 S-methyl-5-thioribose-1-phosphate isomerase [Verrucomicrobiota bacterium]MBV9643778.1 S-methyl-5-thioribose-1-phosphate isomerase [Verrucomicrobiota bacterium]